MLAQLLIQFQKPIIVENSVQNITSYPINDTLTAQLNNTIVDRNIRSIPYSDETIHGSFDSQVIKDRFVAPENSYGKMQIFKRHLNIA